MRTMLAQLLYRAVDLLVRTYVRGVWSPHAVSVFLREVWQECRSCAPHDSLAPMQEPQGMPVEDLFMRVQDPYVGLYCVRWDITALHPNEVRIEAVLCGGLRGKENVLRASEILSHGGTKRVRLYAEEYDQSIPSA